MNSTIPARYRPLAVLAIVAALGFATYVANVVLAEPEVADCCASGNQP